MSPRVVTRGTGGLPVAAAGEPAAGLGAGAAAVAVGVVSLPSRYLSNQLTMCWSRSTRCHGRPERESSWLSPGNRTITVGCFRYLRARNSSSPPADGGVRQSSSPRMNISGVWIFVT